MRKMAPYKGVELLVPQKGEKPPNAGPPKGLQECDDARVEGRDPLRRREEQARQR